MKVSRTSAVPTRPESTLPRSALDHPPFDLTRPARAGFTDGVLPAACPTRVVLDHVTSKWGVLVLIALTENSLRWGELRRVVEGISEKMLAQTLRVLEADGFVLREARPTIPPRVDYSLTDRGREITALLIP